VKTYKQLGYVNVVKRLADFPITNSGTQHVG